MHSNLIAPIKPREFTLAARNESKPTQSGRDHYRMTFAVPSWASPVAAGFFVLYQAQTSVTKCEIEFDNSQEFAGKSYRANVWRSRLLTRNALDDVDAISETVESVIDAVTWFGPTSVSLEEIDIVYANASHLVAVLRSTFNWRHQVPGWFVALQAAPEILAAQGLNPEEELFGLQA